MRSLINDEKEACLQNSIAVQLTATAAGKGCWNESGCGWGGEGVPVHSTPYQMNISLYINILEEQQKKTFSVFFLIIKLTWNLFHSLKISNPNSKNC